MKKFIAAIIVMFAFTVNASAQAEKNVNPEEAAKIEAYKMAVELGLEGEKQGDFIMTHVVKKRMETDPQYTPERRAEASRIVQQKLESLLTPAQLEKLRANPAFAPAPPAPVAVDRKK